MSVQTPPRPFEQAVDTVRTAVRDSKALLLCLDFDGTLAPIVEEPTAALPKPANEAAVSSLAAHPRVTTAIVSGRALADVRGRIDGPAIYAGNHGLELERKGSIDVHPIAQKRTRRMATVRSLLERTVGTVPNCRVENKRVTVTVHCRSVPESLRPIVHQRTHEIVDRFGDETLEILAGKRVLEIRPAISWGKGNAVELIEADLPPETVSVYIGDDVTDESAFRVVESGGFGVRVGEADPSAASFRVDSPDHVASLLEWFGSTGVELLEQSSSRS